MKATTAFTVPVLAGELPPGRGASTVDPDQQLGSISRRAGLMLPRGRGYRRAGPRSPNCVPALLSIKTSSYTAMSIRLSIASRTMVASFFGNTRVGIASSISRSPGARRALMTPPQPESARTRPLVGWPRCFPNPAPRRDGPVVNPSGGLISNGHPLGATGLAQVLGAELAAARTSRQPAGRQR